MLSGASGATGSSGEPSLSQVAAFDYDFERRRLSKTSGSGTTASTLSYVYAGSQVVNEFSTNGTLVNRYDYGADLLRGEFSGEGERFYFADALGSVTTLAQATGGAASQSEYDAWGGFVGVTSPSTNRVGFTGQRFDSETALMPLGNGERYYSPALGQFTQQDSFAGSLSLPQSLNRHSYVHNNPLAFVDPSGHNAEKKYADRGYIQQAFDDVTASFAERSNDSDLAFYAQYQLRNLESVYNLADGLLGGYLHRQDRLGRNYLEGNLSTKQFLAGTWLNNVVSAPIAGANVALAVSTRGAAGVAFAGGRGAMLGFLGKMGIAGGMIGAANLLAEDSFNKAIYDEPFHEASDYAKAAGEGAAIAIVFALLELGGAKAGAPKPKPGAKPEARVEGVTSPSTRTVPAREFEPSGAVPPRRVGVGAAHIDGPEFSHSLDDVMRSNGDDLYAPFSGDEIATVRTNEQRLLTSGSPTTRTLAQVRRLRNGTRWEAGEQYVQEIYGSQGQRHFAVPETSGPDPIVGSGGRFVDAPVDLSGNRILANEVKTYLQWRTVRGVRQQGAVPLSEPIRQQVLKDVWLRQNRRGFDPRWIFLDAPPSEELANFLNQHNITHILYR